MTQVQPGRTGRGLAGMMNAASTIAALRTAYAPRFGDDFTNRMVRGAKTVIAGAWVMVIGLVLLVIATIVTIILTRSIPAGFLTALLCFIVIVIGFVINAAGVSQRTRTIQAMSERIIRFDPKVTPAGAARLIHAPQLYDRWMAEHPGFVSH